MMLLYIVQESIILTKIAHFSKICFHVPAHESTISVDSVAPASRIRVSDMLILLITGN
jgi:hypothetical protein